MARVNITVPDELLKRARAAGLNVSHLASAALAEELDRRTKLAELDTYLAELITYLAELNAEFGPVATDEASAARAWVDRVLPATRPASS